MVNIPCISVNGLMTLQPMLITGHRVEMRFIASLQRFRVNSWEGILGDYPHRKLNKQSFILYHANESKTHQKNYAITGDNFPHLANP